MSPRTSSIIPIIFGVSDCPKLFAVPICNFLIFALVDVVAFGSRTTTSPQYFFNSFSCFCE